MNGTAMHARRGVAGLVLCLVVHGAAGDESRSKVWLNPGFLSYHVDRGSNFREDNIGYGAELLVDPDVGFFTGRFVNSQRSWSTYAMAQWRPLHWKPYGVDTSAGLIAGLMNGYPTYHDRGWFLGALPMLFFEGERFGVNLTFVPSVNADKRLVAIQLKFRVR
jgi:hypothetical protein